jgi:hypothetical protein
MKNPSVKTIVRLATELHVAYTAVTAHEAETKRLIDGSCTGWSRRERYFRHIQLLAKEERATDKLALAIENATQDRLEAAEFACGSELAYVFDGF